jgi:hypothetical protein
MFTLARPLVLPARKAAAQTQPVKTLLSERYAAFEDYDNPVAKTIRSVREYKQLRKLHPGLPAPNTINFTKYAVVAFYIVLPTPCHRVDFVQDETDLDIVLKGPDPLMMCADVLAPTVIVKQMPVKQQQKLQVEIVKETAK